MMSTKECKPSVEAVHWVGTLVDTFWNGYETGLSSWLKQVEDKEDACLRALSAVRKVSQEYRDNLEGTVRNVAQAHTELLKNLGIKAVEHESQENGGPSVKQWQEVTKKLEEIAWTPWQCASSWVERSEQQWEESAKEWVQFLRDRRKSWVRLNEEYVSLTKKNQRAFLESQTERWQAIVG